MIRFERVSKRYPNGNQALSELSFELADGEFCFLTGHSGAGKSTLLRLVMMLERASRGTVEVAGRDLGRTHDRMAPRVRQGIGMIFQDHKLLNDKTVFDNVALPLLIAGFRYADIGKKVRAALKKVGLADQEQAWPLSLSGGEQQRVGVARAIVGMPPLLLADEPTGNLDPELSWELFGLFRELNQRGMTVLIASHDLHLVRRMGERVLVLSDGRLVDDLVPAAS
ncbi:cell division ATP-binding protein FtsE [Marinihelvus fidelis]|uniref:Cell division ATP-binding protein FtsE n=1 Tax=Marinihelvus fidelis TaxID=2613842 RepID=A0A5N0TBN2_9GAMM|nr:cell division ATP-binding protein FtsE [Marinihelvus fidelis]KAA9131834.1 cell division ATP-binding protein FtsE [Marinihelvus fidelis]